jgi:N-acetylmuramoyl-L-alanine amidase
MSMIRKTLSALIAVMCLTAMAPSQAEDLEDYLSIPTVKFEEILVDIRTVIKELTGPKVDAKELDCLANNIFYEAGNQPEEGKVAVGVVTLNRTQDKRFGSSVCSVVEQRLKVTRSKQIATTQIVKANSQRPIKKVTFQTILEKVTVCQFSWSCTHTKKPTADDERWVESRRVAEELLTSDNYDDLKDRYRNALYFHAVYVHPSWARVKHKVKRVGEHIFYSDI